MKALLFENGCHVKKRKSFIKFSVRRQKGRKLLGKHCEAIFSLLLKQEEVNCLLMAKFNFFFSCSESIGMIVLASGARSASEVWASQGEGFQNLYLCSAPSGVRNEFGTVLQLQTTCF